MLRNYEIVWRHPEKLRFYPYNSKVHEPFQVQQICASIQEFKFTRPVLIDEEDMVLAGHGAVMAARSLVLPRVPCLVLDDLTEEQKRAYVIVDNKLPENAEWDLNLLRLEIKDLAEVGFDLGLLGFSDEEFANIMKGLDGAEGAGVDPEEFTLIISSKDEAEIRALRKIFHLSKNGVKVKARDVLAMIPGDR